MPLRAIIFDFDGVIANSEPLHLRAYQDVLASEGLTLDEAEYYARYLGHDDAGAFKAFGADRGRVWTAGELERLIVRKAQRLEVTRAGPVDSFSRRRRRGTACRGGVSDRDCLRSARRRNPARPGP